MSLIHEMLNNLESARHPVQGDFHSWQARQAFQNYQAPWHTRHRWLLQTALLVAMSALGGVFGGYLYKMKVQTLPDTHVNQAALYALQNLPAGSHWQGEHVVVVDAAHMPMPQRIALAEETEAAPTDETPSLAVKEELSQVYSDPAQIHEDQNEDASASESALDEAAQPEPADTTSDALVEPPFEVVLASRLEQARQCVAQGDTEGSLFILKSTLADQPGCTEARTLLIQQCLEQGMYEDALTFIHQGQSQDPNPLWTRLEAAVFIKQGDLKQALKVLENKNAPSIEENPEYWSLKAELARKTGALHQAIQYYTDVLNIYPEYGKCWVGLGVVLEQRGHARNALQSYKNALETDLSDKLRHFAQERVHHLLQQKV